MGDKRKRTDLEIVNKAKNKAILRAEKAEKQLTKAKEIIKELLNSCFGYNSKTVNYEVKAKAEQFLKENA